MLTWLDMPLFGLSDISNFTCVQFGLGLGAGRVRNSFKGVAITSVNWHEGQDLGVNLGLVNLTNQVQGFNAGFINYAERTTFQPGLFNATRHLDGVQICLGNYAANDIFPVLPFITISKSF